MQDVIYYEMRKKLNWELYTNSNRNTIIESFKDVISNNDGSIMNFNMFSDLAMTLSVEIEENRIEDLHNELSLLAGISEIGYDDFSSNSKKEWLIFMTISFTKGTGEIKQVIPEAPG